MPIRSKVQSLGAKLSTKRFVCQTALSPEYKEFTHFLQKSDIPGYLRSEILNHTQKISSAMMGRIFVASIPHMELKTGSFEELAAKTGVSLRQVSLWVNKYAWTALGGENK